MFWEEYGPTHHTREKDEGLIPVGEQRIEKGRHYRRQGKVTDGAWELASLTGRTQKLTWRKLSWVGIAECDTQEMPPANK